MFVNSITTYTGTSWAIGPFHLEGYTKICSFLSVSILYAKCCQRVGGASCVFNQQCLLLALTPAQPRHTFPQPQLLPSPITPLPSIHSSPAPSTQLSTSSLPVSSHLCPPTLPHHLALVLQSHKAAKLPATGEESKEAITQESGAAAKPPSALAENLKPKPQNWKKSGLARTQKGCSLRARCGRAPSEELRTQR